MDNADDEAEEVRGVINRLRDELVVLDRLGLDLAANALHHVLDLLGDGRGKLDAEGPADQSICRSR